MILASLASLALGLAPATTTRPSALPGPLAHPDSLSSSRIDVSADLALVELRCQVASWREVVTGLDPDGDLSVSQAEVDARRAEIEAYVSEHYQVWTETDRELEGGVRLRPEFRRVEVVVDESMPLSRYRDWIDVQFVCRHETRIRDVLVQSTLFQQTSPEHFDVCTISWTDPAPEESPHESPYESTGSSTTLTIDAHTPRVRFDPEGRGAFGVFFRLGLDHILSGWDHLAFVVALVFATLGWRALLAVVTAFTLAHSLTLGLAALGYVDVGPLAPYVEAAIALSIAYVATETVIDPDRRRSPWIEAFLFGLIHGLGFAGFLGQSLLNEQAKVTALFAFNVGVEAGQLAVVAALLLALWPLARLGARRVAAPASAARSGAEPESPKSYLAPRWLRRAGSAVVALLGLAWFFDRVLFGGTLFEGFPGLGLLAIMAS